MGFQLGVYGRIKIYVGNSSEIKPTGIGIRPGYSFIEKDTGAIYVYDGFDWLNVSSISNILTINNSDYTIKASDNVILVNTGDTNRILTLPASASVKGKIYTIKKIDAGLGTVTIDGAGSETIDGALTQSLATQYAQISIVSDGVNWFII